MVTSPSKDPFEQLVDNCRIALDYVAERRDRAGIEFGSREEQAARIEAAMAVLTGEEPPKRVKGQPKPDGRSAANARRVWTPEQRQAASDRMRARHLGRNGDAPAPLAPASGAASDAEEA